MKFKIGQRVRLVEEQDMEDMCPIKVGEEGIIKEIDFGSYAEPDLLAVDWDTYCGECYYVWDWEVELVK